MPALDENTIIYEQPLNERMRAFLRLEYLFGRAEHELKGTDTWSSWSTLDAIIDIMTLISRADLKKELVKELEHQVASLEALARNPKVDQERLSDILERLRAPISTLRAPETAPGHELKENDLISAFRQRSSIPAGTCGFDLPAFHRWLQGPLERRLDDLRRWLGSFDVLKDAVSLCLGLVRDSVLATRETAADGFFQKTLETATPCQMIRIGLPADARCFPEVSAGKHRFTVRFMRQDRAEERPVQTDEQVEFELLCCVM